MRWTVRGERGAPDALEREGHQLRHVHPSGHRRRCEYEMMARRRLALVISGHARAADEAKRARTDNGGGSICTFFLGRIGKN